MAAINNDDPQFEVYRKRLFDEVVKGNLVMIKMLAKKNPALLNCTDIRQRTVLHLAAGNSRLVVIEWLLSDEGRAAGFSSVLLRERGGFTVLHGAATLECFKAIVNGCKVENGEREQMLNAVSEDGVTVLHMAIEESKPTIIRWLLSDKKGGGREAGFSSVLAPSKKEGMSALHFTAQKGDLDCFTAIVEGCKVENGERKKMLNAVTVEEATVLHVAAHHGHVSIIKWLLSKGRDDGFESILARTTDSSSTALDEAAEKGHLEACKAIVSGCKVENGERDQMLNGVDDVGFTPLHYAAIGGHTSVVNWLLSDKPGGGRALGFNNVLTRSKKEGGIALHLAAQYGHLETCKAIVDGCKVENGEREKMMNAVDEQRWTVLHFAVHFGRPDIISWLLSHDADGGRANGLKSETITAVTNLSLSPLHYAAQYDSVETMRALLSSCTVGERLRMFLAVDENGWTVLHYAAQSCRVDNIRELLLHHEETKMIVDHRDHRGMTALHRVILDGGVDEDSKKEWEIQKRDPSKDSEDSEDDEDDEDDEDFEAPEDPFRAPREEVVEALLTYEYDDKEEGGGKAPSKKKGNKKQERKQQQQQHRRQEQQAAFINVNLGLTLEQQEEEEEE